MKQKIVTKTETNIDDVKKYIVNYVNNGGGAVEFHKLKSSPCISTFDENFKLTQNLYLYDGEKDILITDENFLNEIYNEIKLIENLKNENT